MKHFIGRENFSIILEKIVGNKNTEYKDAFITNKIIDMHMLGSGCYAFPIYIYHDDLKQHNLSIDNNNRQPNFNMKIIAEFSKKLDIKFEDEAQTEKSFTALNVLDYIYAVLYSSKYCKKYREFLKIDFPRIPYPDDAAKFWSLAKLGKQLRQIHLFESDKLETLEINYPVKGDNCIKKISFKDKKVYINDTQYFNNVPQTAWNFYIGNYLPAQQWLKDRKTQELSASGLIHYQKIIVALSETEKAMQEIDKIVIIEESCVF
jgi:predicted helicase